MSWQIDSRPPLSRTKDARIRFETCAASEKFTSLVDPGEQLTKCTSGRARKRRHAGEAKASVASSSTPLHLFASFISILPDSRRAADGTAPAASAAAADGDTSAAGRGAARGKAAAGPRLQKEEEEELPLEEEEKKKRVVEESSFHFLSLSRRRHCKKGCSGAATSFFFLLQKKPLQFTCAASAFSPLAAPLSLLSSLLGRPRATAHPQQRARGVEKERGLL